MALRPTKPATRVVAVPSSVRTQLRALLEERLDTILAILDDPRATARDKLAALDFLARYGLGPVRELSLEQVRHRLEATLQLLERTLDEATLMNLMPQLAAIWSADA